MRQLLIDDLTNEERAVVDSFLKRNTIPGPIAGMYWLAVPKDLLGAVQRDHEDCGPFFMGIELGDDRVAFELLVRSQTNLHCNCIAYATPEQRGFLLELIDRMVREEQIRA